MNRLRTYADVATELGVSTKTLKRRIQEAGIHPVRIGRSPLLSEADIAKVLDESRWRERGQKNLPARLRDPAEVDRLRRRQREQIRRVIDSVSKEWRSAK